MLVYADSSGLTEHMSAKPFVIEHKLNYFRRRGNMLSHTLSRMENRVFKSGVQWDFFWTESKEKYAYIIPRDRIPVNWKYNDQDFSERFDSNTVLTEFRVDYRDKDWVENVLAIVNQHQHAQKYFEVSSSGLESQSQSGDEGDLDESGSGEEDESDVVDNEAIVSDTEEDENIYGKSVDQIDKELDIEDSRRN